MYSYNRNIKRFILLNNNILYIDRYIDISVFNILQMMGNNT